MNTAVLKLNWFTALALWLRGSAQSKAKVAKPEEKSRVRIAGLR